MYEKRLLALNWEYALAPYIRLLKLEKPSKTIQILSSSYWENIQVRVFLSQKWYFILRSILGTSFHQYAQLFLTNISFSLQNILQGENPFHISCKDMSFSLFWIYTSRTWVKVTCLRKKFSVPKRKYTVYLSRWFVQVGVQRSCRYFLSYIFFRSSITF